MGAPISVGSATPRLMVLNTIGRQANQGRKNKPVKRHSLIALAQAAASRSLPSLSSCPDFFPQQQRVT